MSQLLKEINFWIKSFETRVNWEIIWNDRNEVMIDIEGDKIKLIKKDLADFYAKYHKET